MPCPYEMAAKVAAATKAADAGVVISVRNCPDEIFSIWSIGTSGRIIEQQLAAEFTSEARLAAHVRGFIDNHLKAFAELAAFGS